MTYSGPRPDLNIGHFEYVKIVFVEFALFLSWHIALG